MRRSSRRLQRGFIINPYAYGTGGGAPTSDYYFADVVALLHFDGSDGSTTFTDSSGSPKTFTAYGNAQIDTAQSKFGGASGLFDGTGDYIDAPHSSDWNLGTGDFTIECWVRRAGSGVIQSICTRQGASASQMALQFRINASDKLEAVLRSNNGTNTQGISSGASIGASAWTHVAFTRQSATMKLWINGVQDGAGSSGTSTQDLTESSGFPLTIGALNAGSLSSYFNGHIDDLRITKGVARYVGNYVVPIGAFPNSA